MRAALPILSAGDAVRVVAPAGPVDEARLERGLDTLRSWGLRPVTAPHARGRTGYLAGTDDERAADLVAAFDAADSRAVFYARGGYGTSRLLDSLPLDRLRRSGKLLAGYSDLTALGLALCREEPFPHLYGPSVGELGLAPGPEMVESYRAGLFGLHPDGRQEVTGLTPWQGGSARAVVLGGCLSLIVALVGTPHEPDYTGRVLFIEEVNEEPYRIDRMLTHLASAGRLDGLAGLLVGQLTGCCPRPGGSAEPSAEEVIAAFASRIDGPVLAGLPAGHGETRLTVPLGVSVEIDGTAGAVLFHHR